MVASEAAHKFSPSFPQIKMKIIVKSQMDFFFPPRCVFQI